MRNLIVATAIAVLGISGSLVAGDTMNPAFFGTWKMKAGKSNFDPGPKPRRQTIKIERHGDAFTMTVDADNADGTHTHLTRTAALDGKEVKAEGSREPNAREAFARIDDRSFQRVLSVNGQVRGTLRVTLADDGKSLTTTAVGTNAEGTPVHNTVVFEKE